MKTKKRGGMDMYNRTIKSIRQINKRKILQLWMKYFPTFRILELSKESEQLINSKTKNGVIELLFGLISKDGKIYRGAILGIQHIATSSVKKYPILMKQLQDAHNRVNMTLYKQNEIDQFGKIPEYVTYIKQLRRFIVDGNEDEFDKKVTDLGNHLDNPNVLFQIDDDIYKEKVDTWTNEPGPKPIRGGSRRRNTKKL